MAGAVDFVDGEPIQATHLEALLQFVHEPLGLCHVLGGDVNQANVGFWVDQCVQDGLWGK